MAPVIRLWTWRSGKCLIASGTAAEKITEALRDNREEAARKTKGIFIRVKDIGVVQYFDVVTAEDIKNNYMIDIQEPTVSYHVKDLPQNLAEPLAVLSILNDGQYVARVGQKIDDRTYWVEAA